MEVESLPDSSKYWHSRRNAPPFKSSLFLGATQMRLSYRGISYEYTPPTLEVTEGEIQSKYRGAPWRCHTIAEARIPQAPQNLENQNIVYSQQDRSQIERVQPSQTLPVHSTFKVLQQLKHIHSANAHRSLEHRMQVAKDREDYKLLQILESELRETVLR